MATQKGFQARVTMCERQSTRMIAWMASHRIWVRTGEHRHPKPIPRPASGVSWLSPTAKQKWGGPVGRLLVFPAPLVNNPSPHAC